MAGFPPPTVFLRAKTVPLATTSLASGVVGQLSGFFLKSPVTYARVTSGSDADLSLSSTGAISSAAGFTLGQQKVIHFTATGADGVVIPGVATLTGAGLPPSWNGLTLDSSDPLNSQNFFLLLAA